MDGPILLPREPKTTQLIVPQGVNPSSRAGNRFSSSSTSSQRRGKPTRKSKTKHSTRHSSQSEVPPFRTSSSQSGFPSHSTSFVPTTHTSLHTSPSSTYASTGQSSGSSATNSALPQAAHHSSDHSGLSSGSLAAAIVVPILAVILIGIAAFFCLRRRRRASHSPNSSSPSMLMSVREKTGLFRGSRHSQQPPATPVAAAPPNAAPMMGTGSHVLTSAHNDAYYSGLDTSMDASPEQNGFRDSPSRRSDGGTFADPPPPYLPKTQSPPGKRGSAKAAPSSNLDRSQQNAANHLPSLDFGGALPVFTHNRPSPENSPISPAPGHQPPHQPTATNTSELLTPDPLVRPSSAQSTSGASITSTLYSDSASVHSAHEAATVRGSVIGPGGGEGGSSHSRSGSGSGASEVREATKGNRVDEEHEEDHENHPGRDPFTDPSSSPGTPGGGSVLGI